MTPHRPLFPTMVTTLALLVVASCQVYGLRLDGELASGAGSAGASAASARAVGSGELSVRILAPTDGDIFETPDILLVGEAAAGTVISVNDALTIADIQGDFAVPLHLEVGTNLLEIVASNGTGDQVSATLVVSFLPPA